MIVVPYGIFGIVRSPMHKQIDYSTRSSGQPIWSTFYDETTNDKQLIKALIEIKV